MVKVTITLVHEICPENEYLSDEDLINGTIDGFIDDPGAWLEAPMTSHQFTVHRDDGTTLTESTTDEIPQGW